MPRAKPKRNWIEGFSTVGRVPLSAKRFAEIADEICGVPDNRRGEFRKAIERALAGYLSERTGYDQAPRPTHIRASFAHLEKSARDMLRVCDEELNLTTRGRLIPDFCPDEERDLVALLHRLADSAQSRKRKLEKVESRHRPTKSALRSLIAQLAVIFDRFADPELEAGDGERPLSWRTIRLDFVETTLTAANETLAAIPPSEYPKAQYLSESFAELAAAEILPDRVSPIDYPKSESLARMLATFDRQGN